MAILHLKGHVMAAVVMYTTMFCPFCSRAKRLLEDKGAAYDEIDVSFKAGARREMMEKAGGRHSVPQIFIDDVHVGGCDELYELEYAGKLDSMLQSA